MAGIHLSDDASMSRVSTFHDLNARWTTKDRDAIRSHSVKKAQAPGGYVAMCSCCLLDHLAQE